MTPLVRRLVDLREGEGRAALLSALYFFCLLSSYYTLRPLRDAMGVSGDFSKLFWLYIGTLGTMLVMQPLYGWLVSRWPRRVFVPVVSHFFALNMLVFLVLLTAQGVVKNGMVEKVFFVWVSVFNLFVVSVFWAFMADLWSSEQGKRLFGFVGIGGTLGAIAGAGTTEQIAKVVDAAHVHWVLLLSLALLECATLCVRALRNAAPSAAQADHRHAAPDRALKEGGAMDGLREVAKSRYLLGICVFMIIFPFSSTLVYFEQAKVVRAAFPDAAAKTAAFAQIDRNVNILTLILQLLATGRLIKILGLGKTMSLLSIITMAGFAALARWPSFQTLSWFQVVRRGADYGVARPAREALYTVVPREQKYKAKAFIDTFVYRAADVLGAKASDVLTKSGVSHAGVAWLFAPLGLVWIGVSLWLGMKQKQMAAASAAPA